MRNSKRLKVMSLGLKIFLVLLIIIVLILVISYLVKQNRISIPLWRFAKKKEGYSYSGSYTTDDGKVDTDDSVKSYVSEYLKGEGF